MDKIELIDRVKLAESVAGLAIPIDYDGNSDRMYLLGYNQAVRHAMHLIRIATAIDAAPVRRGEWVQKEIPTGYFTLAGNMPWVCSACEATKSWDLIAPADNFCPHCGADMRRVRTDDV